MVENSKLERLKNGEKRVLTYVVDGVDKYVISHSSLKEMYYLYRVIGNELVKTTYKSKNPLELEKYFKE